MSWDDVNREYLSAVLGNLIGHLDQVTGDEPVGETPLFPDPPEGPEPALLNLASVLGLSEFEMAVLALCAGVELETAVAERCAGLHGDPGRRHVTFGLALAVLPGAHWTALSPAGPLRRWRLVELDLDAPITTSRLRIDEWALHHLAGVDYLDERLAVLAQPMADAWPLLGSHETVAQTLAQVWVDPVDGLGPPVVCLTGRDEQTKRHVAQHACAHLGLGLAAMECRALPSEPEQQDGFLRLWSRQAALTGIALLIDGSDIHPDACPAIPRVVEAAGFPLLITSRDPWRSQRRPIVNLAVEAATREEQHGLWSQFLPDARSDDIEELLGYFNLGTSGIATAARMASVSATGEEVTAEAVWNAARVQARPQLDDLATRIDATATWDDLVLPEFQRSVLAAIAHHVRQRDRVYGDWGFAARTGRGLGISALFVGQSGTGKTTAAEVLARELRLDLYRIDLSQVVSKYIGETEKNLRRVFDAAEDCGAILLFDEADALFGKRSEVRDSHDRYANIEISYLLQRMETYRGLAILTTNLEGAIDTAFMRRLRFVVEFGFPDQQQRSELWRKAFPADTPVGDLAVDDLSRLSLTGGNIHNIALGASFLAAGGDQLVEMSHVIRAARTEYAKLGRPVSAVDIRGWS